MVRSTSVDANRSVPLLQITMDYISIPRALATVVKVADEVDHIEIGTPLVDSLEFEGTGSFPNCYHRLTQFRQEVESGAFPTRQHYYTIEDNELAKLLAQLRA